MGSDLFNSIFAIFRKVLEIYFFFYHCTYSTNNFHDKKKKFYRFLFYCVRLPAGIAHLHPRLANVNRDHLPHPHLAAGDSHTKFINKSY